MGAFLSLSNWNEEEEPKSKTPEGENVEANGEANVTNGDANVANVANVANGEPNREPNGDANGEANVSNGEPNGDAKNSEESNKEVNQEPKNTGTSVSQSGSPEESKAVPTMNKMSEGEIDPEPSPLAAKVKAVDGQAGGKRKSRKQRTRRIHRKGTRKQHKGGNSEEWDLSL